MPESGQSSARSETGREHPQPPDGRVLRIAQAIEADPSVTIAELARMVNLSSSRLAHLCKATTGINLQSFLSSRRLGKAAELLESTDMPIKEISYSVGYRHAPSFVRAFRSKFGSSPNDYRSQQRLLLSNS